MLGQRSRGSSLPRELAKGGICDAVPAALTAQVRHSLQWVPKCAGSDPLRPLLTLGGGGGWVKWVGLARRAGLRQAQGNSEHENNNQRQKAKIRGKNECGIA